MFKAVDKWLFGYLRSLLTRTSTFDGTRHLIFCLCDHFEPFRGEADATIARQTVRDWLAAYPAVTGSFRDADGHAPRHSFFYPQEEYDAPILENLAAFCRRGYGEVEIHLHHRHDTAEGFREKLVTFRDLLHEKHGLLGCSVVQLPPSVHEKRELLSCQVAELLSEGPVGQSSTTQQPNNSTTGAAASGGPRYAFIHGNWALCNSRPDGDWCGVNEELGILADTGCYADFTFPSAPSPTQPRMVNAIYYASDIPGRPRSADRGAEVKALKQERIVSHEDAKAANEDSIVSAAGGNEDVSSSFSRASRLRVKPSLLIITGPLALNWKRRKWGILPRLENAELSGVNPGAPDRVRLWADQQIGVGGRPDWVFVKVHTHGCVPANARVLLGEAMKETHHALQHEFNDGIRWQLHYVTAREVYNLVKAAEANLPGPPGLYRDLLVKWKT